MDDETAAVFYRIVPTDSPTLTDFLSHAARGLPPPSQSPEVVRLWSGISVFDSLDLSRGNAAIFPRLGRFIATLVIPLDSAILYEKTRGAGHYTLWGEPATL